MKRSRNYIFIKTLRVSGWCLLALLIGFLLSGYAIMGRFHLGRFIKAEEGKNLHLLLHVPLIVAAVAHVVPAAYFASFRWFKKRHRR